MALRKFAQNLLELGSERLKRAKEQGFDVDNPIYHGTSSEKIDAFDESLIGSATDEGHYGRGIYFASTPGEASYYGPNVGSYYKRGKYLDLNNDTGDLSFLGHFKSFAPKLEEIGALSKDQKQALESYRKADNYVDQNVRYVKAKNQDGSEGVMAILKVDGPAQEFHSRASMRGFFPKTKEEALENIKYQFYRHAQYEEPEKYPGIGDEAASLSDYVRTDLGASNLTEAAKSAGYDGIVYADETIVFDPKNIRSVDAEFDPENTDSKKLLASVAPLLIGGGLLANQDAQAGVLSSGAKNLLDAAPERLKQAKEQGFNFDNVMYHASKQDIDEFTPGYDDGLTFLTPSPEFASNWLGKGKFQKRQGGTGSIEGVKKEREQLRIEGNKILESLPESERQKYYEEVLLPQDQQLLRDEQVADSAIYPVVTKTKKPFVPSKDVDVLEELYGKDYLDAPFGSGFATFRDAMRDGNYLLYENKQVVDFLKSKGYDSMFLKESSGKDAPFTTFAVFEPKDIRSVNAQFDPKKTDSAQLLAGAAPVGLLSQPTAKDKAVAVGETLLDAGQAMIAPIAAAPHALIPALLSDRPTAQIEQSYQNLLQQQNYEPSTQLGQQYSQQAQQFMGDAFDAAAQSAPGRAAKEFLAPINLLMQQAPDRARLIGRSLLDMSPF